MAEHHESETKVVVEEAEVEAKDRGLFDFLKKKDEDERPQEEVIVTEFEKVQVSEPEPKIEEPPKEEEEKKHSLLEKLHRSDSSSSSVSSIYIFSML